VTSFINIKYGDIATEILLLQIPFRYCISMGKKELMQIRFTLKCIQYVATSVLWTNSSRLV